MSFFSLRTKRIVLQLLQSVKSGEESKQTNKQEANTYPDTLHNFTLERARAYIHVTYKKLLGEIEGMKEHHRHGFGCIE
jgi:hypothetical protein